MYQAVIYYSAYEDDYKNGESLQCDNSWDEKLEADTIEELRNKVLDATYTKWEDLDDDQYNEYKDATEYNTSYLTDELNQGQASAIQVEEWKQGKCRLWAINCHILVSKIEKSKAKL